MPPVLYVPCRDAGPEAEVVARTTRDGRRAVFGYTALDRLHAACGTAHPWALLSMTQLEELHRSAPYDVLYPDLTMPEHLRITGPAPDPQALPPVLYLPCRRHVARMEDAEVEVVRGQDGLLGLPVYTSLDRLRAGVAPEQPWLLIERVRLDAVHEIVAYDRLLVDETLTITAREGD